jgi:hypothetical protein
MTFDRLRMTFDGLRMTSGGDGGKEPNAWLVTRFDRGREWLMMVSFRLGIAAALIAGITATLPSLAIAASPQQATVRSLVGTWSCITHGSDKKTYRETDTDAMFGNWLRIDSAYPAQNGQPAGTGVTFFGYDAKNKRWVVTGVGTDGSYFMASSTSPAFDGAKFSDQYPNDHGTAVLHMSSSAQYSMDTQGPGSNGKMMTQHVVCTRQ